MTDANDARHSSARIVLSVMAIMAIAALIMTGTAAVSRFEERLQGSLGEIVRVNEQVVSLTAEVKKTGETALSGSREAHERIDRLDARIMAQEASIARLRGRLRRAEEDVQALKTIGEVKEQDVREETQDKPSDAPAQTEAQWPPTK